MLPVDLAVRIKDSTAAINLMDLRLRALKDNINLDATMRQGCVESGHGIDAPERMVARRGASGQKICIERPKIWVMMNKMLGSDSTNTGL